MKEERDYIQDLTEIRSMMERSSKFLSLSGWAGILAGLYALAGSWIAYYIYSFKPETIYYGTKNLGTTYPHLAKVILLAVVVLIMAIGTAIFLSYRKANSHDKQIWNATSRRLLIHMSVPLFAGGIVIVLLLSQGLVGLMAPLTLLFYGLALFSASTFTYGDLKFLGLIQIVLGLLSCWLVEYSLLLWAIGFGVMHIIYGIYMHFRYER